MLRRKIDFHSLREVRSHWKGAGFTLSQVALNDLIMVLATVVGVLAEAPVMLSVV